MVIPAELPYLLVWWKRGSGGLEGLAFIQVALGVQRRVPGRGFEGKFGLGAAVMGQVLVPYFFKEGRHNLARP